MFQVDDEVVYGNTGVCRIIDMQQRKLDGKDVLYYVLKPLDDKTEIIYCPVNNNKVNIRKLMTTEEIYELIHTMPETETEWIENDQKRKEKFNEILKDGDCHKLVKLIKSLYYNREEKKNMGKKFYVADERIMKQAEKILHGELAYVLKIQPEEVVPFIIRELKRPASGSIA